MHQWDLLLPTGHHGVHWEFFLFRNSLFIFKDVKDAPTHTEPLTESLTNPVV